jgi:hypothetical protein
MAEPENQTLHILREIRTAIQKMEAGMDSRFEGVGKRFDEVTSRMDNIRQALNGESVLGRAIDKRIAALEDAD